MSMSPEYFKAAVMRAVAVLILIVNAGAQFEFPRTPPTLPPDAPPVELWQQGTPTVKFCSTIYREVFCGTLRKEVSFEWRYATPELPSATIVKAHNPEVFKTTYWPTFVLPVGDYGLCIAGKGDNGDTIIEHWRFGSKSSSGTPAPSVREQLPEGGGSLQYAWTLPPRESVNEVVRLSASSKEGLVRGIFPSLASENKVYAYYDTSKTIVLVDLLTKSQQPQAAPTSTTPTIVAAPALTNHYQRFWTADYAIRGYCYLFAPVSLAPGAKTLPDIFALIDTTRDGTIDSMQVITAADWKAQGWGDAANRVQPR